MVVIAYDIEPFLQLDVEGLVRVDEKVGEVARYWRHVSRM
jgi:hypothetical protein